MTEYLMPPGVHTITSHGRSFTGDAGGVIDVTDVPQVVIDDVIAHAGVTLRHAALVDGQHTEAELAQQEATKRAIDDAVRRSTAFASQTPPPAPSVADGRVDIDSFFSAHPPTSSEPEPESADETDEDEEETTEQATEQTASAVVPPKRSNVLPPKRAKVKKSG